MQASRGRRVEELILKLDLSGQALAQAAVGLAQAETALRTLRELASAGSSKVMP